MNSSLDRTRWLVALQGYTNVPDDQVRPYDLGLRTSPLACLILAAVGTVLVSPALLIGLSGIAMLGAIMRTNLFDVIYNHGFRYWLNGQPLPRYEAPRRFACAVASVWLLVTAGLMVAGQVMAGQIMGWIMVAIASVPVVTGLCLPSLFYRKVTGTMPARGVPVRA